MIQVKPCRLNESCVQGCVGIKTHDSESRGQEEAQQRDH